MLREIVFGAGIVGAAVCLSGCPPKCEGGPAIADPTGIYGSMGDPMPSATAEQRATFARGKAVFTRRFNLSEGLGPTFNVESCGACHERPTVGGGAGLYRNFFIGGTRTVDGALIFGEAGGVVRLYHYGPGDLPRPVIPASKNVFAQRNPIPFFGAGLIASVSEDEILSHADPDDLNRDGISGRPNYDSGFIGRFGRKAQVVTVESFIRGPLFNHVGITSDPLSEEQRAKLPVDSSKPGSAKINEEKQGGAPDGPLVDQDGAPDPEMSPDDLFDLVSFAMLLAVPTPEQLDCAGVHGQQLFDSLGCAKCHIPELTGSKGRVPLYTDLLLHDMGPDLADGIQQGVATGLEFRTQPLVGIMAVGPYLHDGRAATIREAILLHGGEAQRSRDAFAALAQADQADVLGFLDTLGGRSQYSTGLLPPNTPVPSIDVFGGPRRTLTEAELARYERGRELFDHDFSIGDGTGGPVGGDGAPRFNGDSCRACHFDPVLGGAGPRSVNVMRHGVLSEAGVFSPPSDAPNTILHREIKQGFNPVEPTADINVFEHRQTPAVFGLGLIDAIAEETIRANEDPDDADGDGIRGRAHVLDDGRLGRFGWKAQVPSIDEFVRDAGFNEVGLTQPPQPGLSFGATADTDGVPDPEMTATKEQDLAFFVKMLGPPPRQAGADSPAAQQGAAIFSGALGCAKCHIPELPATLDGVTKMVPLYSDLLLHTILAPGAPGIEDGDAGMREFRTPPLWGLSQTAPYLHSGEAETIDQAIRLHDGESAAVRDAYIALPEADRTALLTFLGTL